MVKYKIIVNLPTINLTFKVDSYEVVDSTFYRFLDPKSGRFRIYDTRICDIIEVNEE